jgi:hypothetical protein
MADVTVRKQRLRTLENQIRLAAEQIEKNGLEIGRYLCEIRDDELWQGEADSWNQYLKQNVAELVKKSFTQAKALIQAAEIEKRIPESIRPDVRPNLGASHIAELGRLAPTVGKKDEPGAEKDYSRIRPQDVGCGTRTRMRPDCYSCWAREMLSRSASAEALDEIPGTARSDLRSVVD